MPRIGELLIAAGLLTAEQIEQAIRAQVMWGGRLGTNLVELGYIDLDKLATALSRQHGIPAALGRHFERGDAVLQRLLPADVAERFSCIPILRAGKGKAQLIIASIAPLDPRAIKIVAAELGVEPKQIIQSVAGELRVRYHLERVYKIPRNTRFLRSRGKTIPPFPQFEIDPLAFEDSAVDNPLPIAAAGPGALRSSVKPQASSDDEDETIALARDELKDRLDTMAALSNLDMDEQTVALPGRLFEPEDVEQLEAFASLDEPAIPELIAEDTSSGRERRSYVRTIDAPPQVDTERSLGRIAIKRLEIAAGAIDETPATTGVTIGEATRAIRRSHDRDRVAELVCETLFRFMLSCDAALVLVIRGDAAISWKGFSRSGSSLAEIAVPLDQPGLLPHAMHQCVTVRQPAAELGPIDQLLLVSLGASTGDLVIVPVSISSQVMCVIAMATSSNAPTGTAESIAAAAGAAFARLMRNASR